MACPTLTQDANFIVIWLMTCVRSSPQSCSHDQQCLPSDACRGLLPYRTSAPALIIAQSSCWAACGLGAAVLPLTLAGSDADRVALPDELSTLTALTTLHLAFLDAFVPVDSYQPFPLAAPGLRFLSLTGQTVFQNLTYRRGQLPHLGQLTGASLQHCRAPPCSARSYGCCACHCKHAMSEPSSSAMSAAYATFIRDLSPWFSLAS